MDMSKFQMVQRRSVIKVASFQILFKIWTICMGFEWSTKKCDQTKLDHFIYKHNLLNTEFCKWGILEYCRNGRGVTYIKWSKLI